MSKISQLSCKWCNFWSALSGAARAGCGRRGRAHPVTQNSAPAAGARGGGGGPADPGSAKSLSLSFTDPVPESLRGVNPPLRSNIFGPKMNSS